MEEELEAVGIRLNKQRPNIYFKPKKTGGLKINSMVPWNKIDEKLVISILAEYSIKIISLFFIYIRFYSLIILFCLKKSSMLRYSSARTATPTSSSMLSLAIVSTCHVSMWGNLYLSVPLGDFNFNFLFLLKAYNKIDQIPIEEVDRLARMPHAVVIRWAGKLINTHFKMRIIFTDFYKCY